MISDGRLRLLWPVMAALLIVSSASGEEAGRFVFPELPKNEQKDGYSNVCEALSSGVCLDNVSYGEYVGKTGVFVNPNEPVSQVYSMRFFEVEVDGKRLYFVSMSESDDPLDFPSSPLRWYGEVLEEKRKKQKIVGKPVVEGSPVLISFVDKASFEWIRPGGLEKPFHRKEWKGVQELLRAHPPEIHGRILGLLEHTYVEYDEFEEMVRIQPEPFEFANGRPVIEIRINWRKVNPRATATVMYSGNDWMFVDRYVLLAGDHRFESPVGDFQRDNYTDVWEWRTIALDDSQISLIEAVIEDENAKIRFYGNQYYGDRDFGSTNRQALRNMLELWKLIG